MCTFLIFGSLGFTEILIIALVILLLFGGKKIPELMRGLGNGVKSFKDALNGNDPASLESGSKDDNKPKDDNK